VGHTQTRILALALALFTLSGCSLLFGDHPFSGLPATSGKLDKTPEVLFVRGESEVVCAVPEEKVTLSFFVFFKWMPPPEQVIVWSGTVDGAAPRQYLKGSPEMTFNLIAKVPVGMMAYHMLNLLVDGKLYTETTILVDCGIQDDHTWIMKDPN
jgi:hypothetical protein